MAESANTQNNGWTQIRRERPPLKFDPAITIRKSGDIGVNADFVRLADLESKTRAAIFFSADGRRLAFRFHSDENDEASFLLGQDGGRTSLSRRGGRVVQINVLRKQSVLYASIAKSGPDFARRLRPVRDGSLWVVSLVPCFETTYRPKGGLGPEETGIYRYRLGGATVYIGRGKISQRIACPERQGWQFDTIEYSVLNNADAEAEWEARWLEDFRAENGRWPMYNSIGGIRLAPHRQSEAGFG
jgi:hypothetical protein